MSLLRELRDFFVLLQSPDDCLYAGLGFENLRLLGVADERGNVKPTCIRVGEEASKYRAA